MDARLIVAATVFALVATGTPGPNNLMLAASGLQVGFRRSLPMMAGFQTGLLLLIVAVAAGLGTAFVRFPALQVALKAIGVAYLLHLAQKLCRSTAVAGQADAPPMGFLRGAAFQFINPKAWMMATSAVGTYSLPDAGYWPSIAMLLFAFTAMGVPSIVAWTAFGGVFRASLADAHSARWPRRALAILTAVSCLLVFL